MEIVTEKEKIISEFLDKNMDSYIPEDQYFWKNEFNPNDSYEYAFVRQTMFYLFPDQDDSIVSIFADFIISKFPNISKKKILEVASGYIPILTMHLQKRVPIRHKVICIDPIAFQLKLPKIKVIKKEFNDTSEIKSANMIIAHCPCGSLDDIIKQTIKNKTELCVQTCRCGHYTPMFGYSLFNQYIRNIMDRLKILEDNGFVTECEETDAYSYLGAPVIWTRKKYNS